jgi:hypothetical protein
MKKMPIDDDRDDLEDRRDPMERDQPPGKPGLHQHPWNGSIHGSGLEFKSEIQTGMDHRSFKSLDQCRI